MPDAGGAGGGGHAPRLPPARHRHLRPELPQAEKRGARGRESGARRRVSPRTARTTSSPAVKHPRASWNKLGTRRRGAEMRRGLSAKKREEPFVFPRLSLPRARTRHRARPDRRPVPGTGTLPDAGGSGGGGHAPRHLYRLVRAGTLPDAGGSGGGGHATRFPPARHHQPPIPDFYPHRTPRSDRDHRHSRRHVAAGSQQGAGAGNRHQLHQQHEAGELGGLPLSERLRIFLPDDLLHGRVGRPQGVDGRLQ